MTSQRKGAPPREAVFSSASERGGRSVMRRTDNALLAEPSNKFGARDHDMHGDDQPRKMRIELGALRLFDECVP